jgi:hypothetical protein
MKYKNKNRNKISEQKTDQEIETQKQLTRRSILTGGRLPRPCF